MEPAELNRRMKRLEQALAERGMKVTHQRMEVYRKVAGTTEHPDAEAVYRRVRKRIPSISLDTVYRNLWLFSDLGLVNTIGMPRGRLRFDANTVLHHHFSCRKCGALFDFESLDFDKLLVPASVRGKGKVESAHVELKGVCSRCLERDAISEKGRKEEAS